DTERQRGRRIAWRLAAVARWLARQAVEARERWGLWVPVFIGAGIAVYFGLASEPPIWLGAVGLVGAVALRLAFPRWPPAAPLATCPALGLLAPSPAR